MTTALVKQRRIELLTTEELQQETEEFIRRRTPAYAPEIATSLRVEMRRKIIKEIRKGGRVSDLKRAVRSVLTDQASMRVARIVRTEVVGAFNAGANIQYAAAGRGNVDRKQWVSARDSRVRNEHAAADGQVVGVTDEFKIGGERLRYPGDPTASAQNIVNCRCTVLPVLRGQEPPLQPVSQPIQPAGTPPRPIREPPEPGQKPSPTGVPRPAGPDAPPSPAAGPGIKPTREEMNTRLTGNWDQAKVLGGGASGSYKVQLEDGTLGAFKPRNQEPRNFRPGSGIVRGNNYRREVAAARIAEVIEMDDLVPASRKVKSQIFIVPDPAGRNIPVEGIGSLQEWVPGPDAKVATGNVFNGEKDHKRAAAFDYLIGNTDRHRSNWKVRSEGPKKGSFGLIDNGLSFPRKKNSDYGYLNKSIIDNAGAKGFEIPKDEVQKWSDRWDEIEKVLIEEGIEKDAIALARERLDLMNSEEIFDFDDLIARDKDLSKSRSDRRG